GFPRGAAPRPVHPARPPIAATVPPIAVPAVVIVPRVIPAWAGIVRHAWGRVIHRGVVADRRRGDGNSSIDAWVGVVVAAIRRVSVVATVRRVTVVVAAVRRGAVVITTVRGLAIPAAAALSAGRRRRQHRAHQGSGSQCQGQEERSHYGPPLGRLFIRRPRCVGEPQLPNPLAASPMPTYSSRSCPPE